MKQLIVALAIVIMSVLPVFAADGTLTWNANTETDLGGYRIYFAPMNCAAVGPLAPLMVAGVAVQVGKVVTYKHVGLPNIDGTLCWEITAIDTSNNESLRSNRVSKVVNTIPPVAPLNLGVAIP